MQVRVKTRGVSSNTVKIKKSTNKVQNTGVRHERAGTK